MQLSNRIALADRGECAFTAKAQIAQLAGASGLLVINDKEGRYVETYSCVYYPKVSVIFALQTDLYVFNICFRSLQNGMHGK